MKIKKANKSGFLLLEVMVSVVIIASGIIIIGRSFYQIKNNLKNTQSVITETLLLESKMFDLRFKNKPEEGIASGQLDDNENYSWRTETKRLEGLDKGLFLTEADIMSKEDETEPLFYVERYFLEKEE